VARQATKKLNAAGFGMQPLDDAALESVSSILEPLRLDAGDFEVAARDP
jgi:hypothetical protein